MIFVDRFLIVGGAPKIKLYTASGAATTALIRSSGTGVLIGDTTLSLLNGFRLGSEAFPIQLKNNDEIWAIATSSAVVSLLVQS